ncbi:LCAP aminopeptidase, partial [Upupa epops]|nr:LCAP aminopeptidase [Upupa epops]
EDFLNLIFKAMMKDSLNSSHAVSSAVQSPEQIEEMFDEFSYIKGASLLLMLKHYLTEEVFQADIEMYLHNHRCGSAQSDDLWDSMNEVLSLICCWVERVEDTGKRGQGLKISVMRVGKPVQAKEGRAEWALQGITYFFSCSYLWHIPLTYITSSCNFTHCTTAYLLDERSGM